MPSFEVIIPTFNAPPPRLAAAVRSAMAAPRCTGVIIVDDGSFDPAQPPRDLPKPVRLERQANAGPAAARNRGLDLVAADFAFMLDDDDELLPDGVEALVDLVDRLGAAAGVAARIHVDDQDRRNVKPAPSEWAGRLLPVPDDVFRPIVLFNGSGILVHRRLLDAGLRFDPGLKLGEDRDFLRRAADHGPIAVSAQPAVLQRLHALGSTNLTSVAHLSRRVRDHVALLERHFRPQGESHWRQATRWLVNACAKHGVDDEAWNTLVQVCHKHRWPVSWKARWRRLRSSRTS